METGSRVGEYKLRADIYNEANKKLIDLHTNYSNLSALSPKDLKEYKRKEYELNKTMMGALAAIATAISVALFFVIGRLKRDQDLTPALGLSAGLTALFAIFLADTLIPVTADWPNLIFVGLFLLPVSLILITLGPRRLPAAEVGLLMLLETALGPIWAWTVLGEIPSETTILGGTLIVGALGAHGIAAWKSQNKNICQ